MIQWYPGHMAKSIKILKKDLKLVDLVVELLDARVPLSSRNPDLDQLLEGKERITVLNKIDLADNHITEDWKRHLEKDFPTIGVNSIQGRGVGSLLNLIREKGDEINKHLKEKGRKKRSIRIMVIGIPNVGKSAFINQLAGSGMAITGNRPGVTRGRQWIKVGDEIQLLDTPGILWPKFEDEEVGYKLALTGAISDDIFDRETAAYKLIGYLIDIDKLILEKTYDIEIETDQTYDILPLIGKKRGCLMSGGKVDRLRTARLLINDFRKGKLGGVSLEKPATEG